MPKNNAIVTATTKGISNEYIILLKSSLPYYGKSNTPLASTPSQLVTGNNGSLSNNNSSSSRSTVAVSANSIRDIFQQAFSMGVRIPYVFDSVVQGFTAIVTDLEAIDVLSKDPRVA